VCIYIYVYIYIYMHIISYHIYTYIHISPMIFKATCTQKTIYARWSEDP